MKDSQPDKTLSEVIRKVWQMTWNPWENLRVNGKRNYVGTRNMKHIFIPMVSNSAVWQKSLASSRDTQKVSFGAMICFCVFILQTDSVYKETITQNFCIPN